MKVLLGVLMAAGAICLAIIIITRALHTLQ